MFKRHPFIMWFGLLISGLILSACNNNQQKICEKSITLDTVYQESVAPDSVHINLLITETGTNTQALKTAVNDKTLKLLSLLQDFNLSEDQIETANIELQPKQVWNKDEKRYDQDGFTLKQMIRVDLKQLSQYSALMHVVISSQVVARISKPAFYISTHEQRQQSSLAKALMKTHLEAQSIAEESGLFAVGKLCQFKTLNAITGSPRFYSAAAPANIALDDATPPDFNNHFQKIDIKSHVQAQYEILN